MKKTVLMCVPILFFVFACNENSGISVKVNDNSSRQKNLEASHIISSAFGSGNLSGIDSVVAADYLDHTDRGDIKGTDSLKSMIKLVHATNKDMKMDIIHEIADDDFVFTWARFTGTSDGLMMPAGPYDMTGLEVTKFKDGKAIEHWTFMEPREMMKMMPPPAPETKTKKDNSPVKK